MGVQQRIMALGDWSLKLADDTPLRVRQAIATPYAHVVITPGHLNTGRAGDAAILAAAMFTGVVIDPGPQLTIGGVDLAWELGDQNGNGAVLETAATFNLAPFETVMANLVPPALTAGSIETYGLQHVATYQYVSYREAINAACKAFGGLEWRVNPDFTFDAGEASYLYGTSAVAVAVRDGGGFDGVLAGIDGTVGYSASYEPYASRTILLSRAGPVATGGASTFRDGRGNLRTIRNVVQGGDVAPGGEVAAVQAALAASNAAHEEVTVDTGDYAVAGKVDLGRYVHVYDPLIGLYDLTNMITFQGRRIFPVKRRVFGLRWPVTQGMGVYYRLHNGTSASYTDLTPYVEWETGSTQIDVAWVPRKLVG